MAMLEVNDLSKLNKIFIILSGQATIEDEISVAENVTELLQTAVRGLGQESRLQNFSSGNAVAKQHEQLRIRAVITNRRRLV